MQCCFTLQRLKMKKKTAFLKGKQILAATQIPRNLYQGSTEHLSRTNGKVRQ